MMRTPFPLDWPAGWPRTKASLRTQSRFGKRGQISFTYARDFLLTEMRRLGAANVVLSSELPVQRNGLPYAASGRNMDPAIAVWFVLADKNGNHQERVFACDKYLTHAENLYATAKSVEALRGLERWGAADVVTRAFDGFTALPPGSAETAAAPARRTWREVFGVDGLPWTDPDMDRADLAAIVKSRYRGLIQSAHPDAGGSHDLAAELNAALAEAETELAS